MMRKIRNPLPPLDMSRLGGRIVSRIVAGAVAFRAKRC
jgi:hypothetical protein